MYLKHFKAIALALILSSSFGISNVQAEPDCGKLFPSAGDIDFSKVFFEFAGGAAFPLVFSNQNFASTCRWLTSDTNPYDIDNHGIAFSICRNYSSQIASSAQSCSSNRARSKRLVAQIFQGIQIKSDSSGNIRVCYADAQCRVLSLQAWLSTT